MKKKKKYTGAITLKVPPELHEKFGERVKGEGRTYTWVCEQLIAKYMAGDIVL